MTEDNKRLLLAAAIAVAAQFLLSWLSSYLPGINGNSVMTRWGWLEPINYFLTAATMAVGGWIAGRPFIPIALLITGVLWLCILLTLCLVTLSTQQLGLATSLVAVLKFNSLGLVCSLLAASLGAALGARIPRRPAIAVQG